MKFMYTPQANESDSFGVHVVVVFSDVGQEPRVVIQPGKSGKMQEVGNEVFIGCTNDGILHLEGDIHVKMAIDCVGSDCNAMEPEKRTLGAHVASGQAVMVHCTTRAEDEQAVRDMEFCRNNVSNPRPDSQQEAQKRQAEIDQCLKDRR